MAWEERMDARLGVKKGSDMPQPYTMKEWEKNQQQAQKSPAATGAWIQQAMITRCEEVS
jgi:hypothetical protein